MGVAPSTFQVVYGGCSKFLHAEKFFAPVLWGFALHLGLWPLPCTNTVKGWKAGISIIQASMLECLPSTVTAWCETFVLVVCQCVSLKARLSRNMFQCLCLKKKPLHKIICYVYTAANKKRLLSLRLAAPSIVFFFHLVCCWQWWQRQGTQVDSGWHVKTKREGNILGILLYIFLRFGIKYLALFTSFHLFSCHFIMPFQKTHRCLGYQVPQMAQLHSLASIRTPGWWVIVVSDTVVIKIDGC